MSAFICEENKICVKHTQNIRMVMDLHFGFCHGKIIKYTKLQSTHTHN